MKGFQTYSENFRGPGLIVAGRLQGLQDEHFFGFFDGRANPKADSVRVVGRGPQRGLTESRRQMLGFDHTPVTHNHGALERVAQLTNVAWPGIIVEQVEHRFADRADLPGMLGAHLAKQQLNEVRNVFLVFAQRRHMDVEDIEAIVEIAAQLPAGHGFIGHFVGGGEDAHIHRRLDLASQAAQLVVFQHAQQLGLRRDRHLTDLVK